MRALLTRSACREMWREMDPETKKGWEERATIAKDAYLEQKRRWLEERSLQTGASLFCACAVFDG